MAVGVRLFLSFRQLHLDRVKNRRAARDATVSRVGTVLCGYTPNFKLSQREKLAKHHLLSVACFGVGMCLNALVTQGFNIEQITRSMTFLMGVYLLAGSLITRALLRQTLVPGFLTLVEHV